MNPLYKALEILEEHNLFITGGAGVGKSHLIREIIFHYKKAGKNIVALGSTGIAAVNIGGVTVHSFFGLGICNSFEELNSYDRRNRKLKDIYKAISAQDLIIIDEISMVSATLMEMIIYRLKLGSFAGKVIFSGDFYQLPPVIKKQETTLFTKRLAFESDAWRELNPIKLELKISHRTKDKNFLAFLDTIRKGVLTKSAEELISGYTNNSSVLQLNPTHLYSKNIEVDRLNEKKLSEISSPEIALEAIIKQDKSCSNDRLENFKKNLTVSTTLRLKVGAPVLFTVNKKDSFYNGERGEIVEINEEMITVLKNGEEIFVERHDFTLEEYIGEKPKVIATISQFPLRLAWAVTIHKSQGMGIAPLVVNIDNIFESGQLYVALSRASNPSQLFISTKYNAIGIAKRSLKQNLSVEEFYKEK